MERYDISKQLSFIDYRKNFAAEKCVSIWLGGSFKKGTATEYSDVDIYINCNAGQLKDFIYGRGKPVYIAVTANPPGIFVIIYDSGLALDLRVVKNLGGQQYFSLSDAAAVWDIDDRIYKYFPRCAGPDTGRLFHRARIKHLRGKSRRAFSLLSEIAREIGCDYIPTENFAEDFDFVMKEWKKKNTMAEGLERETEYLKKEFEKIKTGV